MSDNRLAEQFARGNGTLFIGAGMSKGSMLPDWNELIASLRTVVDECPKDASLPDVAQFFETATNRAELIDKIKTELTRGEHTPSQAHHDLLSLPVRRIYTTNFDNLLESTFHENKVLCHPIRKTADLSLVKPQEMQLVKLHGDLEHVETIIVTSSDFETYHVNKPALARLIASELQTKTVLFIGYSFNDHDLRMILTQVSGEAEEFRQRLFTIQHKPTPAVTKDLLRRGLTVIPLDLGPEHPSALSDWLREFAGSIRDCGVPISNIPKITTIKDESKPAKDELVGRELELKRVLDGLLSRYPVVGIEGDPGVGKRRLALEATGYCDGTKIMRGTERLVFEFITWLEAKASPKTSWLEDALDAVATVTGRLATAQIPTAQLAEKKSKVRKLLCSYKILVVIEGYGSIHDDALQQWIEEIPDPSKVLLTTTISVPLAWPVPMKGLSEADSLRLVRQFAQEMQIARVVAATDSELLPLIVATRGNPQALRLALGILKGGPESESLQRWEQRANHKARHTEELMEMFFGWAWSLLTADATTVLLAVCVFMETGSEMEALRHAAELKGQKFHNALEQVLSFHLVESRWVGDTEQYFLHPVVRRQVSLKLKGQPSVEERLRDRSAVYFLNFVKRMTTRKPAPAKRYWTSLVTSEMDGIDREWESIEAAISWTLDQRRDDVFIDFVMHLVHYMDSRFLNRERMEYVRHAVKLLRAMDRKKTRRCCASTAWDGPMWKRESLNARARRSRLGCCCSTN